MKILYLSQYYPPEPGAPAARVSELSRAWAAQGTAAMTMNVDEFTRYMNDDIAKWAKVIQTAKITAE